MKVENFAFAVLLVAFCLEPVDEFGEVVEGLEAGFERFVGHGDGLHVADESGAVELAEEGFEGDIDADLEVLVLPLTVLDGDAEAQHIGFFLAFKLLEVHLAGIEEKIVEAHLEFGAHGLLEGDKLPPVEVGSVVDELDDIAEEVSVALGGESEGATVGGGVANLVGETVAVFGELVLQGVAELLPLLVLEVAHGNQLLVVVHKPLPEFLYLFHILQQLFYVFYDNIDNADNRENATCVFLSGYYENLYCHHICSLIFPHLY